MATFKCEAVAALFEGVDGDTVGEEHTNVERYTGRAPLSAVDALPSRSPSVAGSRFAGVPDFTASAHPGGFAAFLAHVEAAQDAGVSAVEAVSHAVARHTRTRAAW